MHSTGYKKNAVQKSYATPLFLVNEKCTLITQVWQNLALPCALASFGPLPPQNRAASKAMKSQRLNGFYSSERPYLTGPFRVYPTFSPWISPLTQALAPKMLGLSRLKVRRKAWV